MTSIELYFDGASRGNPGKAGAGAYIVFPSGSIKELSKALGHATNNQAEYQSIILGLKFLQKEVNLKEVKKISIKGDSQLVIKQLEGKWRVKSPNISSLYKQAIELIEIIKNEGLSVSLQYIPRKENSIADSLANKGADQNK